MITTTLGTLGMANGAGDLTIGFNNLFTWDPAGVLFPNPPAPGTQAGIRVEQIKLTRVPVPAARMGLAVLGGLGLLHGGRRWRVARR